MHVHIYIDIFMCIYKYTIYIYVYINNTYIYRNNFMHIVYKYTTYVCHTGYFYHFITCTLWIPGNLVFFNSAHHPFFPPPSQQILTFLSWKSLIPGGASDLDVTSD